MLSFNDKVALVTGGASGIGKAAALRFAQCGAKVVIGDLQEAGGREVVEEIRALGGEAIFVRTDVTKDSEVVRLVASAVDTYGGLHCALNNAGIEGRNGISTIDLSEEDWHRILAVNLTAVWLCMRAELRHMSAQGGGTIVNTSSVAGLVGTTRGGVAYAASKHGVLGLTKTAAKEFAGRGIRVNAICPSAVETPMLERAMGANAASHGAANPMGRAASPEEVAETALWLCSPASSYVTGVALPVEGGRLA